MELAGASAGRLGPDVLFPSAADRVNRRTWRKKSSLRHYRRLEGFVDAGERIAFERVVEDARRGRVLDIGVGGGRTTAIVVAETRNYVGIDYMPAMIDICREKFPDLTFDIGDARDLGCHPDASFDLVQFSYNGIDAVDAGGRALVLAEVSRVLRPGGAFFFSTFNRCGPGFDAAATTLRTIDASRGLLRLAKSSVAYVVGLVTGHWHRFIYRKYAAADGALRLHGAHDYGILVHATTIAELRADLARHGFAGDPAILGRSGSEGASLVPEAEEYFHVIARKPGESVRPAAQPLQRSL